jgi:hypothetical protein
MSDYSPETWKVVDSVLNAYDPHWVEQEIGDKHDQRERMRRALVVAGLLVTNCGRGDIKP